jgi:hypothetical protein
VQQEVVYATVEILIVLHLQNGNWLHSPFQDRPLRRGGQLWQEARAPDISKPARVKHSAKAARLLDWTLTQDRVLAF